MFLMHFFKILMLTPGLFHALSACPVGVISFGLCREPATIRGSDRADSPDGSIALSGARLQRPECALSRLPLVMRMLVAAHVVHLWVRPCRGVARTPQQKWTPETYSCTSYAAADADLAKTHGKSFFEHSGFMAGACRLD